MVKIGELVIDGLGVVLSNVYTLNITIIYLYVARALNVNLQQLSQLFFYSSSHLQFPCRRHVSSRKSSGKSQVACFLHFSQSFILFDPRFASLCSFIIFLLTVPCSINLEIIQILYEASELRFVAESELQPA